MTLSSSESEDLSTVETDASQIQEVIRIFFSGGFEGKWGNLPIDLLKCISS